MLPISVCIIAHNERETIRGCLESVVGRAAEILVLDAGSTDETAAIIGSLRQAHPRITLLSGVNDPNLNRNKMRVVARATQPWVLSLDADERIPEALWDEIAVAITSEDVNGYWIPRVNFFVGRWLRFGDFYPDPQRRLFRRGRGGFAMRHVHEWLDVEGESGYLSEPFVHYAFPNVQTFVRKSCFYSQFIAEIWAERGVRWSPVNHLRFGIWGPARVFYRRYIRHQGFRDGFPGFLTAFILAFQDLLSYAALKELTTAPGEAIRPYARLSEPEDDWDRAVTPDLPEDAL
jgi:glycosyltransferase involved in cell wall biosynthesis